MQISLANPSVLDRSDSVKNFPVHASFGWHGRPDFADRVATAFDEIGARQLNRANRASFFPATPMRGEIREIRQIYRQARQTFKQGYPAITHVPIEQTSVPTQQHYASRILTVKFDQFCQPGAMAFCGEHALLTYDALRRGGIPPEHLRAITFSNTDSAGVRHDHCVVLYSEKMARFCDGDPGHVHHGGTPLTASIQELAHAMHDTRGHTAIIDTWTGQQKLTYVHDAPQGGITELIEDRVLRAGGVEPFDGHVRVELAHLFPFD